MYADVYTSESSYNHLFGVFHPDSSEQGKAMLWHLPPSRLTLPTTLPTYPLPAASYSLTTIHNNNSSSILTLGLILTQSQSLFCVIRLSSLRFSRTSPLLPTPPPTTVLTILPIHSTQLYIFLGDDIQLQDFLSPMSEYESLDYDSQTILTTCLLTSLSQQQQIYSFPLRSLWYRMKKTTLILTILGAPDLHL